MLGESAPRWGGVARGDYVGLTRAHSRAHLVRAAVEGVALQLALVKQSLAQADLEIDEIRATGGVMKHEIWRQTLASAFGSEIAFPASTEGSGFGAALLGMQALGLIESIDVAAEMSPVEGITEPVSDDSGVYAELLPVFEQLYTALLPANTKLQEIGSRLPLSRD